MDESTEENKLGYIGMNDTQLDKQLEQQLQKLPKEIKPSRDLWAGIDHAIEQQSYNNSSRTWQKFATVAAGFAVFAWLSWLTINVDSDGINPSVNNGGQSIAQNNAVQNNNNELDYVAQLAESYEAQKQALLVRYSGNQSVVADWQKQLDELDKAADAIKQALVADPSNSQLIKMLQQTYQQQLDLIKMVNRGPWQTI